MREPCGSRAAVQPRNGHRELGWMRCDVCLLACCDAQAIAWKASDKKNLAESARPKPQMDFGGLAIFLHGVHVGKDP